MARKRRTFKIYTKEGSASIRLGAIRKLARDAGLLPQAASTARLDTLAGTPHHQGVVLECAALPIGNENGALALLRKTGGLMLALDQVTDPQNLGAAARNAAAFGVCGLLWPRHQAAPPSPAASKASAGRLESLPLFEVSNLSRFLDTCRKSEIWVVGLDEAGDAKLPELNLEQPLVIVLGSEDKGLRPLVRAKCDTVVAIPTPGGGSLNVAAAAAVVLYHITSVTAAPDGLGRN